MTDSLFQVLLIGMALLLPLSALTRRRLPARTGVWMALAWIGIFATGALIARLFDPS